MLRGTFAVELLLAGVSIDQVSILLGHVSVKTTERHYAPFVNARQEQLARFDIRACAAPLPCSSGSPLVPVRRSFELSFH
jgi:hypothetical protein